MLPGIRQYARMAFRHLNPDARDPVPSYFPLGAVRDVATPESTVPVDHVADLQGPTPGTGYPRRGGGPGRSAAVPRLARRRRKRYISGQ